MSLSSLLGCWPTLLAIAVAACGGRDTRSDLEAASKSRMPLELTPIGAIVSRPNGTNLIARPTSVYQLGDGRFVIGDKSERNIKLVTPGLDSVDLIGRAGSGPGEFSNLLSVGVLTDSIVALEGAGVPEVRVYTTDGALIRSFQAALWAEGGAPRRLSVIDDSLILLTRNPIFTHGKPLVYLADRSGATRAAFFSLDYYLPESAIELAQYTTPFADGRDGLVWVSFSGSDSVFVFDYQGTRLGSVAIPGENGTIATYRSAFDENGGRFQRADSTWALDGLLTAANLVALSGDQALLQVLRFDAERGYDPLLDSGTVYLLHVRGDGRVEVRGSQKLNAGLFGRDNTGRALFLHLTGSDSTESIELTRLVQ